MKTHLEGFILKNVHSLSFYALNYEYTWNSERQYKYVQKQTTHHRVKLRVTVGIGKTVPSVS